MPRTTTKVRVYDPCHVRQRERAWADYEAGRVALFQRRLPDGDLQYEAHSLSPPALAWLKAVGS